MPAGFYLKEYNMKHFIITITQSARSYSFVRYYNEAARIVVMDVLEALFHLQLIDSFIVKEMTDNGRNKTD